MSLLHRRYRHRGSLLHVVTDCRAEENYTLWIRFDDGLEGCLYLGDLVLTSPYGTLSDQRVFSRAALDPVSNTVTWGGGISIDPEVLYRNLAIQSQAVVH